MRVGALLSRFGGVDGVSLETEKWLAVLERMGHQTCVLTGELLSAHEDATVLPALAFDDPDALAARALAFGGEGAMSLDALWPKVNALTAQLSAWVSHARLDALLVENALALPLHLPLGLALAELCQTSGLYTVAHSHGFDWEEPHRYQVRCPELVAPLAHAFPLGSVRQVVLSQAAREALASRGIKAQVIPNVMDFTTPPGEPDAYNARLRADLGVPEDALLLCQVTRLLRRKGIETAIELLAALAEPRAHLVITGDDRDDASGTYQAELCALAQARGVSARVHFAAQRFARHRRQEPDGRRVYALSDAYAQATACTYFSTAEGFGHSFVEAVWARRPILVNDYAPVYWRDIGSLGFDTVMIKDGALTREAVLACRDVLLSAPLRARMTAHNFALGAEHFSFEALEEHLAALFGRAT